MQYYITQYVLYNIILRDDTATQPLLRGRINTTRNLAAYSAADGLDYFGWGAITNLYMLILNKILKLYSIILLLVIIYIYYIVIRVHHCCPTHAQCTPFYLCDHLIITGEIECTMWAA